MRHEVPIEILSLDVFSGGTAVAEGPARPFSAPPCPSGYPSFEISKRTPAYSYNDAESLESLMAARWTFGTFLSAILIVLAGCGGGGSLVGNEDSSV